MHAALRVPRIHSRAVRRVAKVENAKARRLRQPDVRLLDASEERIHQIVVRETVERTRFEFLAANEIRLVCIDAQRVTIGVDPHRRERKQVSTTREDSAGGNDQISHLTRFGIEHDAVQVSEIAVLIVPDRDVLAGEKRAEDRFRLEITEPGVVARIGTHGPSR